MSFNQQKSHKNILQEMVQYFSGLMKGIHSFFVLISCVSNVTLPKIKLNENLLTSFAKSYALSVLFSEGGGIQSLALYAIQDLFIVLDVYWHCIKLPDHHHTKAHIYNLKKVVKVGGRSGRQTKQTGNT